MDTLTRMRTFISVVDQGGFSAAGRSLGRSKALVSKYVSELEDELGARLLNRTTRRLSLTEIGQNYYAEAQDIIRQVDALQDTIQAQSARPKGLLRISAPRAAAGRSVVQAIMEFAAKEQDIAIDLSLEDRFVDMVDEGFDVAIRVTDLSDSSLIARKICTMPLITVVKPDVHQQLGPISHPSDLVSRPCIVDTNLKNRQSWLFQNNGDRVQVTVKGRVEVNAPQAVRTAALVGLGYARTLRMIVEDDIKDGTLIPVLEDYELEPLGCYVVYANRRHLSSKIRAFVDHMSKYTFEQHA